MADAKQSSPGNPGKRRPPPGVPPGRTRAISPPSNRPTPPSAEELAKLDSEKEEEVIDRGVLYVKDTVLAR